jgi:branched-chain amino acid aminotransferase
MQNKKTILYLITQTEMGGAQSYVYDLACNLKNDYNIIVAGGEQGGQGEIAKKLINKNIKFIEIPDLVRSISPIKDFLALIDIIQLIKKEEPDIIHLNSSKISILGSIAARICHKSGVPNYVIYTAHGWVFNEPISKFKKSFYKYAEKFTSKFKDKIICVSEFDKQTAIKNKIAPEEKLITIHNGIKKIDFLSKELAIMELSKIFPFPLKDKGKNDIFIGSIGNLYPTKGYEYFIKAIHILSYNYKISVKAMIIGGGKEKNNLQNCYIRPLAYKNDDDLGIKSSHIGVDVIIAMWAWDSYYGDKALKLGKTDWLKPDARTVPVQAKASGMYLSASINNNMAKEQGYDDMLMLDVDGNIAECTVSNIFFIDKEGCLNTPTAEGFLNGITRQTIIEIAKRENIAVKERKIAPEELGDFVAVFSCGTAAEVAPIGEIWDEYKMDTNNEVLLKMKELYGKEVRKGKKGKRYAK